MITIELAKSVLLGKRVKLLEPYRTEDEFFRPYSRDWPGYEYGIIVEVVGCEYDRELRTTVIKNVSLHLFDCSGQLYMKLDSAEPMFVDFHVSEFLVY